MKKGVGKKFYYLAFFVLFALFFFLPSASADDYAYANGTSVYVNGVQQFYKGINLVTNLYHSSDPYGIPNENEIQIIADHGFNAIRLPLSDYMSKQSGVWNVTHLTWLNNTFNWTKSRNISVLVDLHRDAVGTPWVGLLENDSNKWGEIAQFWSEFASMYKNETAILGYDLINEPYATKPLTNVNLTRMTEVWREWVNNTYSGDSDKLNKSWNGVAQFTEFNNDSNYPNTTFMTGAEMAVMELFLEEQMQV